MATIPPNEPKPWLLMTGQHWKYRTFWALLLIGAIPFVLFVVEMNTDEEFLAWYVATWMGAVSAAFGWLAASISCRRCHRKVAWWFLTHSSAGSWITDLRYAQQCPVCGDDGLS